MHLVVERTDIDGTPSEAKMTHGDEELMFNIALFDRMSISDNYDIFSQINKYWNYLPVNEQNKIFSIYKEIKRTYDSVWDINKLTSALFILIKNLFEHHKIEDVYHWVWFYSDSMLPLGLRDLYIDSYETPGTRERTYLKDDYKWLVALSVSLRIMIPIWGEFIMRTRRNNTVFKEYYAFLLLSHSNIFNSEPMERLRVYVEHSMPMDKNKASAIFGGISSDEFHIWVLGLVTVRRLSIGDVRGIDPISSLVTFIYKFIISKVKSHDNNFIGNIKDKENEGQATEGENNLSKLEAYKIKQEIAAGDIAIISHFLRNTNNLALQICPDINLDIVEQSIISARALANKQIWKPQVVLTQWVMKKLISPKGLLHVNKMQVLEVLGVAQALLWHRGHFDLAGLISAQNQDSTDELSISGTDSRARITKEQIEKLDKLYPHSRKPVGKQKVVKKINPAIETIESIANNFSEHEWILTVPRELLDNITFNGGNRYSVPYNIKPLLADLVIQLASRTF